MSTQSSYGSPAAFRRALNDKLRALARDSKWSLPQLQRQIAYDRVLERLYLIDQDWIVKGATALLARDIGVRGTIDIDIFRAAASETAERDLRAAATADIGDWFRFELGAPQPPGGGLPGLRVPVTAYIGTAVWSQFHVDLLGAELVMTGEPEAVPPLARVAIPDVEQHGYRAYPLVDHIADKIAAMIQRYGPQQLPSSRYKDLVDLVAIVGEVSVDANAQLIALRSEASRRGITLPEHFTVPDQQMWERGYAAESARSILHAGHTLDEALAIVLPFIDPLLDGTATGAWDPRSGAWSVPSPSGESSHDDAPS